MTVVNPKSISGINSITMASGSDNLLTIHTTNTTERVRVNSDGDVIVGSGITVSPDGDIFATGVTTSTTFVGALTGNVTGNISGGTVAGSTGTFSGAVSGTTGTFTGDLTIPDKIVHTGDTDTAIRFGDNTVTVEAGGSERIRIYQSKILKGLTSARGNYGNNTSGVEFGVQIEGTTALTSSMSLVRNSDDANDGGIILGKTRATSTGGNTVVQAGDDLGTLTFAGNDGSTMLFGAEIFAEVESGVGNDDMPAALVFNTNSGTTSTTERLRIDSSGRSLFSGTLGYANIPLSGNPANAAIHIRSTSKYNGIAFGEGAVSGAIGMGGADTTTAMVFVANANPANLGGGTHDTFEWHSGTSGGGGPGKYMTLDTSGDLTLEDGDLVIGTNGHGIDFSAAGGSSSGSVSALLDDYEEGTCVPTQTNGSFTPNAADGKYTKVGRLVTWMMHIVFDDTSSGNHVRIGNFPFTAGGGRAGAGIIRYSDDDEAYEISWHVDGGAASATGYYMNGGLSVPSSAVSGRRFDITFVYEAAS